MLFHTRVARCHLHPDHSNGIRECAGGVRRLMAGTFLAFAASRCDGGTEFILTHVYIRGETVSYFLR